MGELIKKEWGMLPCKEEDNCELCINLANDMETKLRVRDLYAEGVDLQSIEKSFDLPRNSLNKHAIKRRWNIKRRRVNNKALREEVIMLARRRLMDNWETSNDSTPDKMIDLLARAADIGNRGVVVGVNVNNNMPQGENISWEERAYRRKNPTIETKSIKIIEEENTNGPHQE